MWTEEAIGVLAGPLRVLGGAGAAAALGWTAVAAAPAGGYADLVERVAPAVVFVEVTATSDGTELSQLLPFGPGSPLEDFFERFGLPTPEMPPMPDSMPRTGVGSGFIIESNGTIVTNNHVVADAESVTVRLDDGRSFEAEVVGTDPMTDLALLEIEAGVDLPTVEWGDSAAVRPGDNVIAVGNPFGLGGTVTAGIVSAVARDINAGPYDDFIQIDAAINRGNSGGPLFNEEGEVIGVNTAIFSPSGGSVGIGFAAPSNLAREVIAQLDATGRVDRGFLGVQLQPLSPDLVEALGLETEAGALVANVSEDSPAEAAGVRAGDVIVGFAGTAVEDPRDLARRVAAAPAGESSELEVIRGGDRETLSVTIAPLDPEAAAARPDGEGTAEPGDSDLPELGLSVAPLDEEGRALASVEADVDGVLVTGVDSDGPSAGELRSGDVIVSVQNEPIDSIEALRSALEAAGAREAVLLRVWRGGDERFVGIRPAAT